MRRPQSEAHGAKNRIHVRAAELRGFFLVQPKTPLLNEGAEGVDAERSGGPLQVFGQQPALAGEDVLLLPGGNMLV